MVFAVILGLLFAILTVGAITLSIVFAVKCSNLEAPEQRYGETDAHYLERNRQALIKSKRFKLVKWISAGLVVPFFILLFLIPGSFHTVNAGEIAVVKHLGAAKGVRSAGTYFDLWLTEKYEVYDAKVQTIDVTTQTYSSDAQTMDVQMTVQYQIDQTHIVDIANSYGTLDILDSRIASVTTEDMKKVLSKYESMEIIQKRSTVSDEVTKQITASINSNYYVTIKTAVLTDISFTDAYEAAVEAEMIAQREKAAAETRAKQEAEVAKIAAEAKVLVAEQEALAKERAADGDANVRKTIAAAEAYETQKKIAELARSFGYDVNETADGIITIDWNTEGKTETIIASEKEAILAYLQYLEYLATWDGELPQVVTGENGIILAPVKPGVSDSTTGS